MAGQITQPICWLHYQQMTKSRSQALCSRIIAAPARLNLNTQRHNAVAGGGTACPTLSVKCGLAGVTHAPPVHTLPSV